MTRHTFTRISGFDVMFCNICLVIKNFIPNIALSSLVLEWNWYSFLLKYIKKAAYERQANAVHQPESHFGGAKRETFFVLSRVFRA